jgi:hypothetical protein
MYLNKNILQKIKKDIIFEIYSRSFSNRNAWNQIVWLIVSSYIFLQFLLDSDISSLFVDCFYQKQQASRFLLIFTKILKSIKSKNNRNDLHIANGTYNPSNSQKRGQNMQTSSYCVTNAVEIWWKTLKTPSYMAHYMEIITFILNLLTFFKTAVRFSEVWYSWNIISHLEKCIFNIFLEVLNCRLEVFILRLYRNAFISILYINSFCIYGFRS